MAVEKTYQCLKILKDARELIKCPVCLEIIEETVELSCQHRICKSCFSSITTQYKDLKCCPLCKKAIVRRARVYKDLQADEFGTCLQHFFREISREFNADVDSCSIDDFKKIIEKPSDNIRNLRTSDKSRCSFEENPVRFKNLQKVAFKLSDNSSNKKGDISVRGQRTALKKGLGVSRDNRTVPKDDRSNIENSINVVQEKPTSTKAKTTLRIGPGKPRDNNIVPKSNETPSVNTRQKSVITRNRRVIPKSNCVSMKNDNSDTVKKTNENSVTVTEGLNAFDLLLPKLPVTGQRKVYVNRKKVMGGKETCLKLLKFQDDENKIKVVKWLNDNKNMFERLTQTQDQNPDSGTSEPFNLPSVSQKHCSQILSEINLNNIENAKKNENHCANKNRARSLDVLDRKLLPDHSKPRRHSFAGNTPNIDNYQIDEYNTEEDKHLMNKAEEIALIDIIEDEYLKKIDEELLDNNKSPKGKTLQNGQHASKSKMKARLTSNSLTKKATKQLRTVDDSGWERMKDIRRTIRKRAKVPKKLNITLQTTQNTSKNETQKSVNTNNAKSMVKSTSGEEISVATKTFDLNKLETYISENMQKIHKDNMVNTNQEQVQNLDDSIHQHGDVGLALHNERSDTSLTHSKSNTFDIMDHRKVEIAQEKVYQNDISMKRECLSDISNENTVIDQTTQKAYEHCNENSKVDFESIYKEVESSNTVSEQLNNGHNSYLRAHEENNLIIEESDVHQIPSCLEEDRANYENYDVFNQATQKLIHKSPKNPAPLALHADVSSDLNFTETNSVILRKGLDILDSLEERMKSLVSEHVHNNGTDTEMLSLPSEFNKATKPVTLFLKQVLLLKEIHPFIDQLRDYLHGLQINHLRINSPKIHTNDALIQTDEENVPIPLNSSVKLNDTSKTTLNNSNYLSCFNTSVQTVNVDMLDKDVQTDHQSQEGFLISANEAFKTQELTETGMQTDQFSCPKCHYIFNDSMAFLYNHNEVVATSTPSQKQNAADKHILTEFFDDIDFETQELLKQAEEKLKAPGKSQGKHTVSEEYRKEQNLNNILSTVSPKCGNENADVAVVGDSHAAINEKTDTCDVPAGSCSSQSSVLIFTAPSSILSKKRKLAEVFSNDSDTEDKLDKKPRNRFLPDDDISIVFDSEKSLPAEENLCHSDDSDDFFDHEKYVWEVVKKYDENCARKSVSPNISRTVNMNCDLNTSLNDPKKQATCKDSSVHNSPANNTSQKSSCSRGKSGSRLKETNTQKSEKSGNRLKETNTQKSGKSGSRLKETNTQKSNSSRGKSGSRLNKTNKNANQSSASPEQIDGAIKKRKTTRETSCCNELTIDKLSKKMKRISTDTLKTGELNPPLTCGENKFSDEMADNIFLDEHNMSQIERDIIAFEKSSSHNINSEDTDIIAATENNIDYYKIDKQISKRPNVNSREPCRNSLSENMFSDNQPSSHPVKVQQKDNTELQIKITPSSQIPQVTEATQDKSEDKALLKNIDMNLFFDSDSDQDTQVIANSKDNIHHETVSSKQDKVQVLQNIKLAGHEDSHNDQINANSAKDDMSDTDIVDTTPQKEKPHIDRGSSISQRSLILEYPIPPPFGFRDDEETSTEPKGCLNIISDDVDMMDPGIALSDKIDCDLNNSSVLGNSKELNEGTQTFRDTKRKLLEASTPYSDNLDSEKMLSLSPIPVKNRSLSVIELVRQSKFTPLSISVRPTPSQKPLTISTPKQKSILSYVVKSQERKPNVVNTKPCIACSRLSREQVVSISSMTNKKLATYSNSFTDSVTHMVVSVTEKNCVKDHTMKYILAIASGIWVVNFKWIQECLTTNSIISEEPFEVLDVSGIPGPKLSRLTKETNPLLAGYKFHAAPPFQSTTQGDVEKVISLLGGKVLATPEDMVEPDGLKGIIITEASASQDFEIYEVWLEALKVVTVDIEWLSKSVGQYCLVSLRSFALCSDDSISDLGYPEALIGEPLSYPQNTC